MHCLLGTAFYTTQQLPLTPLWNAVERVLPAGLALLILRPARPRDGWWARSLALGVLNFGVFFALQALASHRLPGAVVSTITATQTLLVPALAALFGERVSIGHVIAAVTGVIGIGLLVSRGGKPLDAIGIGATAILASSAALGLVLTRRWGLPAHVHHLSATAWQMIGGALTLLPLAALIEGPPPAMTDSQIIDALWLALAATAAAFALFFGGLHHGIPPTTVSRLALLSPVTATVLGWLFAAESLNPIQLAGVALVLTAQVIGNQHRAPPLRASLDRRSRTQ